MTAAVILTEVDRSDLRVAASILSSVGGPTGDQLAANLQRIAAAGFRFPKTYCSSCGGEFGPGNAGFSDCADHKSTTTPASARAALVDRLLELAQTLDRADVSLAFRAAFVKRELALMCKELIEADYASAPGTRWERRQAQGDGSGRLVWGEWKPCTEREARRIGGLRTWEFRRIETTCAASEGIGAGAAHV